MIHGHARVSMDGPEPCRPFVPTDHGSSLQDRNPNDISGARFLPWFLCGGLAAWGAERDAPTVKPRLRSRGCSPPPTAWMPTAEAGSSCFRTNLPHSREWACCASQDV